MVGGNRRGKAGRYQVTESWITGDGGSRRIGDKREVHVEWEGVGKNKGWSGRGGDEIRIDWGRGKEKG